MLQFNPHCRHTASQLMRHRIFDELRGGEIIAPQEVVIDLDEEQDPEADEKDTLLKIQNKFVKEFGKFHNKKASENGEPATKYKIGK